MLYYMSIFLQRSSRNTVGRGLGDVTLNLTEFLSYAQRNNYDIVIPASREVCNLISHFVFYFCSFLNSFNVIRIDL